MPNGRVHDTSTLLVAGASAPFLLYFLGVERTVVTAGSFLVSGLLFSPDLDLERSRSATFWRTIRLGWLWIPYAKLIPHRSPLSHHPLLGPLGRILYFALFLFVVLWMNLTLLSLFLPIAANALLQDALSRLNDWVDMNREVAVLALVGFIGGGALHTLLDVVDTSRKRMFNRLKKRGLQPAAGPARLPRRKPRPVFATARRSYRRKLRPEPESEPRDESAVFQELLTEAFKTRGESLGLAPNGHKPAILPPPTTRRKPAITILPPPDPERVIERRPWNDEEKQSSK